MVSLYDVADCPIGAVDEVAGTDVDVVMAVADEVT